MEELEKTLDKIAERGKRLTVDAVEFIRTLEPKINIKELLEKAAEQTEDVFLTANDMVEVLEKIKEPQPLEELTPSAKTFRPEARSIESKIEVLFDPGKKIAPKIMIKDFISLFRSRYEKEVLILKRRLGLKAFDSIDDALMMRKGEASLTVGLVAKKRASRRGIWVEIEDLESKIPFFVSTRNPQTYEKAKLVPLDSVIAVRVRKVGEDFNMSEEIYLPEVESHEPSRSEEEVYAVLTSDLHIGSKFFLGELFHRFVLWLKGSYGNEELKDIASRVKYIVVAGDLVDGVGIYPNQEMEQEEFKVRKQYQSAIKLFEQTPDHINIIILPGNHDATRRALPQPPILREYAEELWEMERCVMTGNPVNLRLHDVNVYVFHGRSLDDCVAMMPRTQKNNVSEAMKILLRVRHIAPTYGLHTRISPQETDDLIIPTVPDIMHAGHLHINDQTRYKNTFIVNSGAWQDQTNYQKEKGIVPTPGIVPVVNLATLGCKLIKFV